MNVRDGRLAGRVNLFDASIVLFAVVLIPIAYAAFLLFRMPAPRITSVEPAQMTFVEDRAAGGTELSGKLKVKGTNLRPILRATIGGEPAVAYIFENPTSADVLFGNLPAGSHDLVLYDGVQEVTRFAKAVTIPPKHRSTSARVRIVGHLIDLDEATARSLKAGAKFSTGGPPDVELVALGDPIPDAREVRLMDGLVEVVAQGRWQRPAAIVTDCDVAAPLQCRIGPVSLGGAEVLLPMSSSGAGALKLRVLEVVPADPPRGAEGRVRFLAPADAIDLIKPGDRDESAPILDDRAATIVSIDGRQIVQGDITLPAVLDGMQQPPSIRASDRVAAIDATLRLGADAARDGWHYRSHPLSVGHGLTFVTARYTIRGIVRSVSVSNAGKHDPRPRSESEPESDRR